MTQLNLCLKRVVQIEHIGNRREGNIRPMKLILGGRSLYWRCYRGRNTEGIGALFDCVSGSCSDERGRSTHKELVEELKKICAECSLQFTSEETGSVKRQQLIPMRKTKYPGTLAALVSFDWNSLLYFNE